MPAFRRLAAFAIGMALAFGPTGSGTALAATQANDDSYTVLEDQVLTISAPGVLENDTREPGFGLTNCVAGVSVATLNGSLDWSTEGGFTYTPDADYFNPGSLNYFEYHIRTIAEGEPCSPSVSSATARITVTPVNDAPSIETELACASGATQTVAEDSGAYTGPNDCVNMYLFGPSDTESGQSLDEWVVTAADPSLFSVQPYLEIRSSTHGRLHLTPAPNEHGSTTLTIKGRDNAGAADGGVDLSNSVSVPVTITPVNDAPTATGDSFFVLKNTTLNVNAPGILGNDDDIDSGSLTAVKVSNPSHGVLTLASDGSFSYTPTAGYEGPDAFSYKASDGSLQSPTRVVSLTVTSVPPINTPTPFPTETLTPIETPGESPVDPSASAEASASIDPSASPGETAAPSASASPAPGESPAPAPVGDGGGGVSLPVLLVIVLFVLLAGFGAALYLPKWLAAQRGGPTDLD